MWRLSHAFAALVILLVVVVLSPLRAVAATIPALIAYDAAVRPTATTRIVSEPSPQPEPRSANEYGYDGALVRYDGPSNPPVAGGTGAVHAYDGTLELIERSGLAEGAIYGAVASTAAAEGGGAAITRGEQVTEEVIRNAMKDAPLSSQQAESVSLPRVQQYVDELLAGEVPPAIKVDGSMIVDGNHRYIAGQILGRETPVIQWLGGRPGSAAPWADIPISPEAW